MVYNCRLSKYLLKAKTFRVLFAKVPLEKSFSFIRIPSYRNGKIFSFYTREEKSRYFRNQSPQSCNNRLTLTLYFFWLLECELLKRIAGFHFEMIHIPCKKGNTHVGGWTKTFSSGDSTDSVRCLRVDGNDLAIEGLYIFGSLTIRTKKLRLWARASFFFLSKSSNTSSRCSCKAFS